LDSILQQFLEEFKHTTWLEFIAVVTGIASVIFSRRENILVYPVGMINTSIFIYLYIKHGLYADASVNFYYTVMSVVGWIMWTRKKDGGQALVLTKSSTKDWRNALLFFGLAWLVLYVLLRGFTPSTVPVADSFTSAAAFTGMWLMNKKKLENWIWWIITDLASVPLNFSKHLAFTAFQYTVFLVLAVMGYITWKKKIENANS
jgi:nicotinamide mononucleotide transporter